MKSFSTTKTHIILQGVLLLLMVYYTFMPENLEQFVSIPILIIIDAIILSLIVSALVRRVSLDNDVLYSKSLFGTKSVHLSSVDYVYVVTAFARWAIILNDTKATVVVTSHTDNFSDIVETIKNNVNDENKKKLDILTKETIARKKMTYNSVLIMLCGIVIYGIIRNL